MNIFEEAAELQKKNIPFAVATITETKGSTPRDTAKMIVLSDGSIIGTIGGGPLEQYIIEQAIEAITERCSRTVIYSLEGTKPAACGGNVTVFIETVNSSSRLILIGGGHVNLAVAEAAESLGFEINVVDSRREFASKERFPMAGKCCFNKDLSRAIKMAEIDKDTFIVIATSHNDEISIREVIDSPAAYIGILGSRRKAERIIESLKAEGYSEEKVSDLYIPTGLDIGSETPEEIALSILAEILKVKNKKTGRHLKDL